MVTRAEIDRLADAALMYLAENPELMETFLGQSGLSAGDLRRVAADPGFAEALLDFLCADDARLMAFANHAGVPAARITHLRAALEAGAVR